MIHLVTPVLFLIMLGLLAATNTLFLRNEKILFPRQSLKIFTFRAKLRDSIFFLLGHSPIKIHLEIVKRP